MNTVQNLILQAFIGELGLCSNSFHIIFGLELYIHSYTKSFTQMLFKLLIKLTTKARIQNIRTWYLIKKKNSHYSYF